MTQVFDDQIPSALRDALDRLGFKIMDVNVRVHDGSGSAGGAQGSLLDAIIDRVFGDPRLPGIYWERGRVEIVSRSGVVAYDPDRHANLAPLLRQLREMQATVIAESVSVVLRLDEEKTELLGREMAAVDAVLTGVPAVDPTPSTKTIHKQYIDDVAAEEHEALVNAFEAFIEAVYAAMTTANELAETKKKVANQAEVIADDKEMRKTAHVQNDQIRRRDELIRKLLDRIGERQVGRSTVKDVIRLEDILHEVQALIAAEWGVQLDTF